MNSSENPNEPLLTYRELERELGVKRGTLFFWVARGEIPHLRLGPRTVRFRRGDLEAWLEKRRVLAGETTSDVPARQRRPAS